MKKIISLIIAMMMCLCACGSNGSGADTKKYRVNETSTGSLFECTLENVCFADRVEAMDYHSDYLLPASENTKISIPAKYGNTLLCFTVKLKYIGTKTLSNVGLGTNSSAIGFSAIYDSDYEYSAFVASWKENYRWRIKQNFDGNTLYCLSFTPLSNEVCSIRAYIEVPEVVAQNGDKTLDLCIRLGNGEAVTYRIQP